MQISRRQILTGLAATTALTTFAIPVTKSKPSLVYGFDPARGNDLAAAVLVSWEGGKMKVLEIHLFDFFKGGKRETRFTE